MGVVDYFPILYKYCKIICWIYVGNCCRFVCYGLQGTCKKSTFSFLLATEVFSLYASCALCPIYLIFNSITHIRASNFSFESEVIVKTVEHLDGHMHGQTCLIQIESSIPIKIIFTL